MKVMDMFDSMETEKDSSTELTVIPTSVIDIAPQKRRLNENHSSTSSRANYSPFPEEVATLCYEFYLRNAGRIFDPFAGWGERHFYARTNGKCYVGYDISERAITNAWDLFRVRNTLADSTKKSIPSFDGLLTCPPYWNLEKYESEDGLDRLPKWNDFLFMYESVMRRCYRAAEDGAVFCIVVGDWRSNGIYYDLEHETCRMFKEFGTSIVDKVVLSRKNISKIKIMLPQAKRLGYSVKVHESLLVFRKGNNADTGYAPIEPSL